MVKARNHRIRIIGGLHRGRKLAFPDLPGLRPTGDRIRETLFNWLQPYIQGARCLDLFAGSGALGLESASRGAGEVVMLDQSPQVVRQLEQHKTTLGLQQIRILQADALSWLEGPAASPFDLVFLDPPFADELLIPVCDKLEKQGWLASGARIYLEDDAGRAFDGLPRNWELQKEKQAGQVRYGLAYRH